MSSSAKRSGQKLTRLLAASQSLQKKMSAAVKTEKATKKKAGAVGVGGLDYAIEHPEHQRPEAVGASGMLRKLAERFGRKTPPKPNQTTRKTSDYGAAWDAEQARAERWHAPPPPMEEPIYDEAKERAKQPRAAPKPRRAPQYDEQRTRMHSPREDAMQLLHLRDPFTAADVKRAFRQASLTEHPDRRGGAQEYFLAIKGAANLLLKGMGERVMGVSGTTEDQDSAARAYKAEREQFIRRYTQVHGERPPPSQVDELWMRYRAAQAKADAAPSLEQQGGPRLPPPTGRKPSAGTRKPQGARTPMTVEKAMRLLHLTAPFSAKDVRRAFQSAAMKAHPDKGGTHEGFLEIRDAANLLLKTMGVRVMGVDKATL